MSGIKIINAGWLIDGTGGPVRKNISLQIQNGRITSIIADPDSFDTAEYVNNGFRHHQRFFRALLTAMFIFACPERMTRLYGKNSPEHAFDETKVIISEHIGRYLSYGVLAVRDGGDRSAHALRYRNEYIDIKKALISIRVAGRAWHRAGRYGGLIGRPSQENHSLAEAVNNDPEEKDHIKIVNSGLNSLKEFGKETLPQFGAEELSDVVKIALKSGRRVMVHANGKKPVAVALEAGCDSIEHGFFMGAENLKIMAEKKIAWVPTACTMKAYSEHMKPGSREAGVSRMNLDHQLEQISKARELGVTVALGTDSGSMGVHHGAAVVEELKLLITAGYSLPEAIRCASCNGARLLGIEDFGVISKDMAATFLVVKGDPSKLPDSLGISRSYLL